MFPSSEVIKKVSTEENVPLDSLTESVQKGQAIIITSRRGIKPLGIGDNLRKKFACIVGTSTQETDIDTVIRKAKVAVQCGASVIHNGSAGGDVREIQKRLLDVIDIPLAVCHPIGVMANACYEKRRFIDIKEGEFIEQLKKDIEQGVEIILLPLGVTGSTVAKLSTCKRIMPCCSKSGSIMAAWMAHNQAMNPYGKHFDEILAIAKEYNTTLSIVGAFRSGSIHDALDELQYEELQIIKGYTDRAKTAGVQIKAGSGGHIPANKIAPFFEYQRQLLKVPIISFGPQVTDISLGYDHVSAAMGQLAALLAGADIIFTVTPAEHISMPNIEQTKQGCIIAKIACHSADIASGKDWEIDRALSEAREELDWQAQLEFVQDEVIAEKIKAKNFNQRKCTLCGEFCALEVTNLFTKPKPVSTTEKK